TDGAARGTPLLRRHLPQVQDPQRQGARRTQRPDQRLPPQAGPRKRVWRQHRQGPVGAPPPIDPSDRDAASAIRRVRAEWLLTVLAFKGGFIRDAAAEGASSLLHSRFARRTLTGISARTSVGIALVFTDTSPRGAGIEGEDKDWDFGVGAGWYLDATSEKYSKYYNMYVRYTYITSELPTYLASLPIDTSRASVHGHSMGGHGALVLYLKSVKSAKHAYASASAYAPCSNPTKSPWGIKAFGGYLKGGVEEGKEWDATELLKSVKGKELKILVDVGTEDHFHRQDLLLPENFVEMRDLVGFSEKDVEVNFRSGYDHSYYMVSTFAPTHVKWHAKILKSLPNKL
ncbi:SPOSA6832_02653, partial [Sporobolomyces salmonicolor]